MMWNPLSVAQRKSSGPKRTRGAQSGHEEAETAQTNKRGMRRKSISTAGEEHTHTHTHTQAHILTVLSNRLPNHILFLYTHTYSPLHTISLSHTHTHTHTYTHTHTPPPTSPHTCGHSPSSLLKHTLPPSCINTHTLYCTPPQLVTISIVAECTHTATQIHQKAPTQRHWTCTADYTHPHSSPSLIHTHTHLSEYISDEICTIRPWTVCAVRSRFFYKSVSMSKSTSCVYVRVCVYVTEPQRRSGRATRGSVRQTS